MFLIISLPTFCRWLLKQMISSPSAFQYHQEELELRGASCQLMWGTTGGGLLPLNINMCFLVQKKIWSRWSSRQLIKQSTVRPCRSPERQTLRMKVEDARSPDPFCICRVYCQVYLAKIRLFHLKQNSWNQTLCRQECSLEKTNMAAVSARGQYWISERAENNCKLTKVTQTGAGAKQKKFKERF